MLVRVQRGHGHQAWGLPGACWGLQGACLKPAGTCMGLQAPPSGALEVEILQSSDDLDILLSEADEVRLLFLSFLLLFFVFKSF